MVENFELRNNNIYTHTLRERERESHTQHIGFREFNNKNTNNNKESIRIS